MEERLRSDLMQCPDVAFAHLADVLVAEGAADAVVIGHSLGAQIAVRLRHRHADRVRGPALIDALLQAALF